MDREDGEPPDGDPASPEIDEVETVLGSQIGLYLLGVTTEEVEEVDQFPRPPSAMSSENACAKTSVLILLESGSRTRSFSFA